MYSAKACHDSITVQFFHDNASFSSSCPYHWCHASAVAAVPLDHLHHLPRRILHNMMLLHVLLCVQMEQLQAELLAAGQALGAGVQLLLLLTRFRFKLAAEEFELLRCALSPVVLEGPEVGADT